MATITQIARSQTTASPTSLLAGELAYTFVSLDGILWIGTPAGDALHKIGGKRYTDKIDAAYTELGHLVGVTSAIQTQLNSKQASDADLSAVAGLSGTGLATRTATDTWTTRTITGNAGRIVVTNGSGVAGNPSLDFDTLSDGGGGTFLKFTRDTYGRVSGTTAVVASDITTLVDATYVNVSGDSMTNFLTLHADPSSALHAATKQYVDNLASGIDVKISVRAATTANITLSAAQTIDGVSVIAGDRVLVKNQTTGSENGIYVAASGAWARSSDADANAEVTSGLFTFIEEGTTLVGSGWLLTTANPITVGTTALTFAQFNGGQVYTAGTNISIIGNVIAISDAGINALGSFNTNGFIAQTADNTFAGRTHTGTTNRLTVTNGDGVSGNPTYDISSSYVGQASITTVGTLSAGVVPTSLLSGTIDAGTF